MAQNVDLFEVFSKDEARKIALQPVNGAMQWLQIVSGEAAIGDIVLKAGDGVGIKGNDVIDLSLKPQSRVLYFDMTE